MNHQASIRTIIVQESTHYNSYYIYTFFLCYIVTYLHLISTVLHGHTLYTVSY